jgi:hypothetical protein
VPRGWQLRVFQDGPIEKSTGHLVGSRTAIDRNIAFYRDHNIIYDFQGERNRGIAEMIYSAKCWAFDQCGADIAIIVEDDVVIARYFFFTMRQFGRFALENAQVGAFSAFGDSSISFAEQLRTRNRFIPMHHRWSFGISRSFWERTRLDFHRYLDLIRGHEYRSRPHDLIKKFLSGFNNANNISHITSQDAVHTALMLHHGGFSFMSPASYAINIGKSGTHMYPDFYYRNQSFFRGRHGLLPFPILFSRNALAMQSKDLIARCIDYRYF